MQSDMTAIISGHGCIGKLQEPAITICKAPPQLLPHLFPSPKLPFVSFQCVPTKSQNKIVPRQQQRDMYPKNKAASREDDTRRYNRKKPYINDGYTNPTTSIMSSSTSAWLRDSMASLYSSHSASIVSSSPDPNLSLKCFLTCMKGGDISSGGRNAMMMISSNGDCDGDNGREQLRINNGHGRYNGRLPAPSFFLLSAVFPRAREDPIKIREGEGGGGVLLW